MSPFCQFGGKFCPATFNGPFSIQWGWIFFEFCGVVQVILGCGFSDSLLCNGNSKSLHHKGFWGLQLWLLMLEYRECIYHQKKAKFSAVVYYLVCLLTIVYFDWFCVASTYVSLF